MDKWLTNLTIDELKAKLLPKPHRPFEINGIPVFMNIDDNLLPGEAFKKHPEMPVEASNFGRIRFNGKVLLQRPDEKQAAPYGYLWVKIPNVSAYQLVYWLVAETWCERPNLHYDTVHHISNNGTDNRPENLLWVTSEQHMEIHFWLKNRQGNEISQANIVQLGNIEFKFLATEENIRKAASEIPIAALLFQSDNVRTFNNRSYAIYGEYDKAIADLTDAMRLSPGERFYFCARGDIHAEKGDYDKAIADYTEAIRLYPDDRDILERREASYEALGQQDKAAADRDEADRLDQKIHQDHLGSIGLLALFNIQLYLQDDIDKIFSEAGERSEKLVAAYLKKGLRSFLDEDEQKGTEFLAKALDIYSGMDQAEAKRLKSAFLADFTGGISKALNNFDKAIAELTEIIEQQPEKPGRFLNNRGNNYAEKADCYKIIAGWIEAIGAEPEAGARFQTYTSDYDRAAADYTVAIQSNNLAPGKLSDVYQNRGKLYADRGDYDRAIADYNEAIRLSPDSAHKYYYNRGIAYDILGDYDQAIADYTEAIRVTPAEYPQNRHFYNRGIVYDEKGEYKKAIADYTSVIHLNFGLSSNVDEALHNRCLAYRRGRHRPANVWL